MIQMEQAGGAADCEARSALQRLTAHLDLLEATRCGVSDDASTADTNVVENQFESLEQRLGTLERRVEMLTPGAQEVLADTAGGFLDALSQDPDTSDDTLDTMGRTLSPPE